MTYNKGIKSAPKMFKEIQKIVKETLKGHKAKVYLFGSWVSSKATRISDIDLAVETRFLPTDTLPTLRERFEDSNIPYKVEIVDLSTVETEFRERIFHKGISIWNV